MKTLKSIGFMFYFLVTQCSVTGAFLITRLLFDASWSDKVLQTIDKYGAMSLPYLKLIAEACVPAMILADLLICIPVIYSYTKKGNKLVSSISVIYFICLTAFALTLNFVISVIVNSLPVSSTSEFYTAITSSVIGDNKIMAFLSTAIMAPIAEEVIFRLGICRILYKDNVKRGIIVSSILFGLAHMNVIQSTYAFVLGLILASAFVKSEYNLAVPILLHVIINGSSVLYEYYPKVTIAFGLLIVMYALFWFAFDYLTRLFDCDSTAVKQLC